MAKTRLSKLKVDEISLVDNPANPAARALIAKRADADGDEDKTVEKCDEKHEPGKKCKSCGAMTPMKKSADATEMDLYVDALNESIDSIMADEEVANKAEALAETVEQFQKAVKETVNKKKGEQMPDNKETKESFLKGLNAENKAELDAYVQKAVETGITALAKRTEEVEKQNGELRAEIAKRDRIAKAKNIVGELPIDAEKFASVLEKVEGNKDVEAFVNDLVTKYRGAVTAGSLFHEVGVTTREPQEGSADAKLAKRVEEIRKASPKVTAEAAYAQAIMESPELYDELANDDSE